MFRTPLQPLKVLKKIHVTSVSIYTEEVIVH